MNDRICRLWSKWFLRKRLDFLRLAVAVSVGLYPSIAHGKTTKPSIVRPCPDLVSRAVGQRRGRCSRVSGCHLDVDAGVRFEYLLPYKKELFGSFLCISSVSRYISTCKY
jgi:hypothetical protein